MPVVCSNKLINEYGDLVERDRKQGNYTKGVIKRKANFSDNNNQILEQLVDSVVIINGLGEITFYNHAAEKMFGYSKVEVLGKNIRMIAPIQCETHGDCYVKDSKKNKINKITAKSGDIELAHKSGSVFWGNLSLSRLELRGQIQYMVIIRDITDEVLLKERFRQTLEQAVDSVVTIDSNKTISFFNSAAEKMFGYAKDEVIGKNVKMVVSPEHQAHHDSYVDANMTTGINKVVGLGRDLEMVRKNGSKFWGNLSLCKVDVGGEIQYTAFIKDITRNIEEDKIRYLAVLEGQEEERKRIAMELHDGVGQIITSIQFRLGSLNQSADDKHVGRSRYDAIKLSDLVNSADQEIRRISNNLSPAILSDFGISEAINHLTALIFADTEFKVKINCTVQERRFNNMLEVTVFRVIQELLNNIRKHSNAKNVLIDITEEKAFIKIRVKDDGMGFDLKAINMYAKSNQGISNLNHRVKLLNGVVRINTSPGKGCEVVIGIPAEDRKKD